jgi:hypothetical protein
MSSRPKLTPLSNLLPAKGAAQRPEPLPDPIEQASLLASEQASNLVDTQDRKPESELASKIASVRATETAEVPLVGGVTDVEQATASEQPRNPAYEHGRLEPPQLARIQASEHSRKQSVMPSSIQASLHSSDDPDEFKSGPRSAVSFRMTERLQERLREFAHRSRRSKQDILDQAVHELLSREGF